MIFVTLSLPDRVETGCLPAVPRRNEIVLHEGKNYRVALVSYATTDRLTASSYPAVTLVSMTGLTDR
jgi:hypothetical protein